MHKQIFLNKKRSDLLFSSFAYHPLKAWNTGVPLSRREFRAKWRQIILPELPQILEILSFIWVCRKNPPNFTWIVFLPCIFLQTAEDGFPLRPWFFSWSRNANLRMRHFVARSNVAKKVMTFLQFWISKIHLEMALKFMFFLNEIFLLNRR